MPLTICFQETPFKPRLTTPKVFYVLRTHIFLYEGHERKTRCGDSQVYAQIIVKEIGKLHNLYSIAQLILFLEKYHNTTE
jgi:hypothetical protein